MPCNLHERNGNVVIPDLLSNVVILDRKNNVIESLGEGEYSEARLEHRAISDRLCHCPL